jgi:hypothetical protein
MAKRSQEDVAILASKATQLLKNGLSVSEVAEQLQVSTRTIQRWRNRPQVLPIRRSGIEEKPQLESIGSENEPPYPSQNDFQRHLRYFDDAGKLEALIPVALDELKHILENPDTRIADKLRACQVIGDWSGLSGGFDGSMRRVLAAGYVIVAPRIPAQESRELIHPLAVPGSL